MKPRSKLDSVSLTDVCPAMEPNTELQVLRKELLELTTASLQKDSRFYKDDYEAIRAGVNRKTRGELTESIKRVRAIANVTAGEIAFHCQLGGLPTPGQGARAPRRRAA